MTNYNKRLDEVIAQASAGIGGFGKLDNGKFYKGISEIEAKQSITSLIKELVEEAERESHKSGYIQAIADFSGYYMDASIPAQRNLIMPHIAIELTESYKYPQNLLKALENKSE